MAERNCLTADEIFAATDSQATTWVPCPEWGKVTTQDPSGKETVVSKGVFVRTMTLAERGKVRKAATFEKKMPNGQVREVIDAEKIEALMVIECAVDADGRRLFKVANLDALMEKSGGPIARIAKAAMRLAGLDADAEVMQDS